MADVYKDLSHTAEQIDATIDGFSAHAADTVSHVTILDRESWDAKVDSEDLNTETTARENADADLQTAISGKASVSDIYGSGTILSATAVNPVDLNDITAIGRYQCGQTASANVSSQPISASYGFALTVSTNGLASRYRQTIYYNSDTYAGVFFERYYTSNGWTVWYKFTGEVVQ